MTPETLPLHPAIVHLPLALAFVIPLAAAVLAWALWTGRLPRWTWALVVGLQALLLAGAGLAMRTGEGDEERVERVVAERVLEAHERAAKTFTLAAAVVAGLFVLVLALPAGAFRRGSSALAVAGSLVVATLALRVGEAGGELVYRHGAAQAWAVPGSGGPASPEGAGSPEGDEDDDD